MLCLGELDPELVGVGPREGASPTPHVPVFPLLSPFLLTFLFKTVKY